MPHLITVLIRSANRATLNAALDSIAAQTYPKEHLTILIADVRGISAQTLEHPITLPDSFPIAHEIILSDMPQSRSAAANLLLKHAQTPFAIFLDDDDYFEPEHLANLMQAIEKSEEIIFTYSGVRCINEQNQCIKTFNEPFSYARLMTENFLPIHSVLFRLDRVQALHATFDEQFDLFEDWDFWLQCARLGSCVHLPTFSAVYRIHGESGFGARSQQDNAAQNALKAILEKWRSLWTYEELRNLIAYARFIPLLQHEIEQLKQQAKQEHANKAQELQTQEARIKHEYENSRSWKLTRPLRAVMNGFRHTKLRQQVARTSLNLATKTYRSSALAPFVKWIPSSVKRRVRNRLMVESRSQHSAPVGIRVHKPLGKTPLVSVIIPVYNHAQYLTRAIESALNQTYAAIEVIAVNDASPDPKVRELLQQLSARYPTLHVHHHEKNQGICAAQNTALFKSSGDIIAFLDCDDYLAPNAIEKSMNAWRDDTVYLHTGRINVDEHDREINRIHFLDLPREDYFSENLRAMYATHLKLIRRDVFCRVGVFDSRFDSAQDYDMLMRIAFHYPSSSFVHVPDFLYFHRIHAAQTTQTQNQKQQRDTERIQAEARLREEIRNGEFSRFISFIMLSYGKHTQTLKAIESLQKTVNIEHEIILYDNGSMPETVAFLREHIEGKFETVRVIYGDQNLGPALGRKKALEHARGEWFIIFDNDEIAEDGWLEELLVRACSDDTIGAVNCRVAFPDETLQFSGGQVIPHPQISDQIDLALFDRGAALSELSAASWREVDWCPIGATLFTVDISPYLHDGYPNTFEDAAVSFALKKQGFKLVNTPAALVWHEHITFQAAVDMQERYMSDRYHPKMMLKSVASFYAENQLLIFDEYIWRENGLMGKSRLEIEAALNEVAKLPTRFR